MWIFLFLSFDTSSLSKCLYMHGQVKVRRMINPQKVLIHMWLSDWVWVWVFLVLVFFSHLHFIIYLLTTCGSTLTGVWRCSFSFFGRLVWFCCLSVWSHRVYLRLVCRILSSSVSLLLQNIWILLELRFLLRLAIFSVLNWLLGTFFLNHSLSLLLTLPHINL